MPSSVDLQPYSTLHAYVNAVDPSKTDDKSTVKQRWRNLQNAARLTTSRGRADSATFDSNWKMTVSVLYRWQPLQVWPLKPHTLTSMKSFSVYATMIPFSQGASLGKRYVSSTCDLTSISIFTNAIERSEYEKRSACPNRKQQHFVCKVFSSLSNDAPIFEGRYALQGFYIPSIIASSMDEIYDALAHRLLQATTMSEHDAKYIVGLAGSPGAGKSTLATEVVHRVNALQYLRTSKMVPEKDPASIAIVVPMDGFHLYRSQLNMMEDPKEAHARRGAPWTFDPARLLSCLKTLRKQGSVYMPSFDHAIGDPVEDDVYVSPLHKIVLVEGNYLLLEDGLWRDLAALFDERWFLQVDIDIAMQRVEKRHILIGDLPEVAKWQVEYNDRPNAEFVAKSRKNADLVIHSVEYST